MIVFISNLILNIVYIIDNNIRKTEKKRRKYLVMSGTGFFWEEKHGNEGLVRINLNSMTTNSSFTRFTCAKALPKIILVELGIRKQVSVPLYYSKSN